MRTLVIPPAAQRDDNSVQMLSAWIAEQGLHCTLNIGFFEASGHSEAKAWGILLADLARHIGNAVAEERGAPARGTVAAVVTSMLAELDLPTSGAVGEFHVGHAQSWAVVAATDAVETVIRAGRLRRPLTVALGFGAVEKLKFALDVEDEWPPFAAEGVWCERSGKLYELKSAPFFIKGLAFGDKFTAEPDPVNGCIFEFEVVESSGNSLVWVLNTDKLDFSILKHELSALGCSIEELPRFSLFSVDVPASADAEAVNALVERIEERGFSLAFPVWRHEAAGR